RDFGAERGAAVRTVHRCHSNCCRHCPGQPGETALENTFPQAIRTRRNVMDITIFGAAGDVGKRIVNEALIRGHKVTGVVRSEAQYAKLPDNVRSRVADAAVPAQVARMAEGQDLVISAVRPPEGREDELVAL